MPKPVNLAPYAKNGFDIIYYYFPLSATFSSLWHLSRQLLWSLAQSKMIKELPEAGTRRGASERSGGRGHRGDWWKSVEVVPANSCCASRATNRVHSPVGRNSGSRASVIEMGLGGGL